jgi:hypothetical protein
MLVSFAQRVPIIPRKVFGPDNKWNAGQKAFLWFLVCSAAFLFDLFIVAVMNMSFLHFQGLKIGLITMITPVVLATRIRSDRVQEQIEHTIKKITQHEQSHHLDVHIRGSRSP